MALMKSPRAKTFPFNVNLIAEKSGLPDERCDQRSQQILCKRSHNCREGSTNHHTNRHIDHVATPNKLLESVEQGYPPETCWKVSCKRYDHTTLRIRGRRVKKWLAARSDRF